MTTAPLPELTPKVLLADPDIDSHVLYAQVLGLKEREITHATEGRDALVKALEYPFALVITEIRLSYIDGYALCKVLRHDSATRNTPIMVVTADARPAALERALRAGADVALAKPVTDVVFTEAQRLILRTRDLRDRSGRARLKVAALLDKSKSLLRSGKAPTAARRHKRYGTTQPPITPPSLRCPSCDRHLNYEFSHIGGVTAREPEQWDYYTCSGPCGQFQYRQRTRKLRQL
jgi:CheY-like chemotaxis protein